MARSWLPKLLAIAALPLLLGLSAATPSSPSYHFTRKAASNSETVAGWMVENAVAKAYQAVTGTPATVEGAVDYFSVTGRPAAGLASHPLELEALEPGVELLIQQQVGEALVGQGLGLRVLGADLLFPPVLFRFEALPKLLVVSPREKIERLSTVLLRPEISLADAEGLEEAVSRDGFSALVTPIGGLGIYPSMVPKGSEVGWTLRTVAHEWAHQFFALRPLGWKYALGAEGDEQMVVVNETAAEILGREVGDEVYRRYYRGRVPEQPRPASQQDSFRAFMRDVRRVVDSLLADGKVDEAESFMESARQSLEQEGYQLRKLNQAYFAFHGSYSDEMPVGGAVGDDIGDRLRRLRAASPSVGEFVWRISSAGSYDEFLRVTTAP